MQAFLFGYCTYFVPIRTQLMKLAENRNRICLDVLLMPPCIHDAGKAYECRFNHIKGAFEISDLGALIGQN
jgi:hypothetical protein